MVKVCPAFTVRKQQGEDVVLASDEPSHHMSDNSMTDWQSEIWQGGNADLQSQATSRHLL